MNTQDSFRIKVSRADLEGQNIWMLVSEKKSLIYYLNQLCNISSSPQVITNASVPEQLPVSGSKTKQPRKQTAVCPNQKIRGRLKGNRKNFSQESQGSIGYLQWNGNTKQLTSFLGKFSLQKPTISYTTESAALTTIYYMVKLPAHTIYSSVKPATGTIFSTSTPVASTIFSTSKPVACVNASTSKPAAYTIVSTSKLCACTIFSTSKPVACTIYSTSKPAASTIVSASKPCACTVFSTSKPVA